MQFAQISTGRERESEKGMQGAGRKAGKNKGKSKYSVHAKRNIGRQGKEKLRERETKRVLSESLVLSHSLAQM